MSQLNSPCIRFQAAKAKSQLNLKNAMMYLSLRENKCPKKEARIFTSKSNCKFDATQKKVGPQNYRIINVQPNPFASQKGWLLIEPDYQFTTNEFDCLQQFKESSKPNDKIHEQFQKNVAARIPKWQEQEQMRVKLDQKTANEWLVKMKNGKSNVKIRNTFKIQITQLREKFNKKCNRDTELYISNQKFQEISGLVMKNRINYIRKTIDKQIKSVDLKTFKDITETAELNQAKIQQFNRKSKPPQEREVLFATQNSTDLNDFQSLELIKLKDEDFYNLMNNDDENDEGQEQFRSQKKRIKDILTYGFSNCQEDVKLKQHHGIIEKKKINYHNITQLMKARTANLDKIRKKINLKLAEINEIKPFDDIQEQERSKTTRNLMTEIEKKAPTFLERKFTLQVKTSK